MLGSSVSFTVTLKEQRLVLPLASVATQTTVETPLENHELLAGVHVTVASGQLSVTGTENETRVRHWPDAVPAVMSAGQTIFGFSTSRTITRKTQLTTL